MKGKSGEGRMQCNGRKEGRKEGSKQLTLKFTQALDYWSDYLGISALVADSVMVIILPIVMTTPLHTMKRFINHTRQATNTLKETEYKASVTKRSCQRDLIIDLVQTGSMPCGLRINKSAFSHRRKPSTAPCGHCAGRRFTNL